MDVFLVLVLTLINVFAFSALLSKVGIITGPSTLLSEAKKEIPKLQSNGEKIIERAIKGYELEEIENDYDVDELYLAQGEVIEQLVKVLGEKLESHIDEGSDRFHKID